MFPQRVGRGQVSIGDTQGKKRFVFSYTDFVPAAADTLSAARGEPGARCCRAPRGEPSQRWHPWRWKRRERDSRHASRFLQKLTRGHR